MKQAILEDHDCRDCARHCSCIEGKERETTGPLVEILTAIAIALGCVIGIILTVAFADQIEAACQAVVKWIWL